MFCYRSTPAEALLVFNLFILASRSASIFFLVELFGGGGFFAFLATMGGSGGDTDAFLMMGFGSVGGGGSDSTVLEGNGACANGACSGGTTISSSVASSSGALNRGVSDASTIKGGWCSTTASLNTSMTTLGLLSGFTFWPTCSFFDGRDDGGRAVGVGGGGGATQFGSVATINFVIPVFIF